MSTQALEDPKSILQEQSSSQVNSQNMQQQIQQSVLRSNIEFNSTTPSQQELTLWIGDLPTWWDENYVLNLFSGTDVQNVKIIRNKQSKQSEGYGFVQFQSQQNAFEVLQTFNGQPMPGTQTPFKLNWAAYGVGKNNENDFSVFVGDLTSEVNDLQLEDHFKQYFQSVKNAKVIVDSLTGRSKGFGFVKFGSQQDRNTALNEMGGQLIGGRPIRVSTAISRKLQNEASSSGYNQFPFYMGQSQGDQALQNNKGFDNNNTTIFVGGLNNSINQENLKQFFVGFGEIVNIKIPPGKGCGFVQFTERAAAENAIVQMNGQVIGNSKVRTSWGRSSKQLKLLQQQQQQQLLALQQQYIYNPYGQNKYSASSGYPNTQFNHFDQYGAVGANQNAQQFQEFYGAGAQHGEFPYSQQQVHSNNPYFNQYGSGRSAGPVGVQQSSRGPTQNMGGMQSSIGGSNQVGEQGILKSSFNNLNKINYSERENEGELNNQKVGPNQSFVTQNLPAMFPRNMQQFPRV